jgi:membrane protease YdiL (CAAX protease family)
VLGREGCISTSVPSQLLFAAGLVVWAGCFLLISRLGTWAPLALLGPLLAGVGLAGFSKARALIRPDVRLLAIGLGCGLLMTAGTYALFALLVPVVPAVHTLTAGLYYTLRTPWFTPAERALVIPLVAASEEVVFRGIALPENGRWAVVVKALIVGVAHLSSGNWPLALAAFLCGVVWGGLRVATRSCIPSIATHVIWDTAILVVHPLV